MRARRDLLKSVLVLVSVAVLAFAAMLSGSALAGRPSTGPQRSSDPPNAVHFDTSPPLTEMPLAQSGGRIHGEEEEEQELGPTPNAADPVIQSSQSSAAAPTPITNILGVGKGFTGPQGAFTVTVAPPDTDGDVGPNHYVQMVNSAFAIFNKSGTALYGPAQNNTLWSGFGGGCQTNNDGDGIVKYDKTADRWILTQFSVSTTPFLECVAISTSPDPLGSYFRYSFEYTNFPDYPKLAVWPDAYYLTFKMFAGPAYAGAKVCAYDRAAMLTGSPATQQCFDTSTAFANLLPSDIDGPTPPPAGSPNYIMNLGATALNQWKFHVDWTTPLNSTMTGPISIPIAAYSALCGGGDCVRQPGTNNKLASLGTRVMFRLAYRNFGSHEALVANHSVTAGTGGGVRWYELRINGGTTSVYQQGTFAPDASFRWMGSIAMDQGGNIALGYSISGTTVFPSVGYAGHLTTDPLGVMGQGETTLVSGGGSQKGGLHRWGDYSAMAVDPVDDCTFWYTQEYIATGGAFNWSTRIGSFKFPTCGPQTPDFSLSASPASQTVAPGGSTSYGVTISPTGGFADSVTLGVSGLPSGANGSFSPNPATASSTLSVTTTGATPQGSYPFTITGISGSLTHTTSATLVVSGGGGGDFTLSASPPSRSVVRGASTTYTVTITPSGGFTDPVTFSASGGQPGSTFSFSPNPATATSTLTVQTSAGGPTGTFTITITGTSGSLVHTTPVTIQVTGRG